MARWSMGRALSNDGILFGTILEADFAKQSSPKRPRRLKAALAGTA
ncbi:hypothetical protein IIC65_02300 [Candidatus Sumerlaeota bacterium]|nr:hypothetical protein [Candidatus Sumerlaeota bacterium]